MTRLKSNKTKINKIKDVKKSRGCDCEQYPSFSFRYLTQNNHFNFNYFKTENERNQMMNALVERLTELSKKPYTYWLGQRKGYGCELIEMWKCRIIPNELVTTNDDKIFVFRFKEQKYRILGIKLDSCPTLYIIGFDFDFSAYNHGS